MMNDDELRALWRKAGGDFHGPRVETGTMPEAKLLPFLRELQAAERERCAKLCEDRRGRDIANGHISHAMAADDCARAIRGA